MWTLPVSALLRVEQRGEGAGVEYDRDRRDLAVADAIPLAGPRTGHRRCFEVVDDARVVAVDEHLLLVCAGSDPAQLPQRRDVVVRIAEGVDRARKVDIVVKQRTCPLEILARPGVEETFRYR